MHVHIYIYIYTLHISSLFLIDLFLFHGVAYKNCLGCLKLASILLLEFQIHAYISTHYVYL